MTHRQDCRGRWSLPPEAPLLQPDVAHLWLASLTQVPLEVERLGRLLSADEHDRAGRFHFEKHRSAYVVARGLLRTILGRYLGVNPTQLQFCYGPHGKPALAPEYDGNSYRFNLSHAGDLVLYAVALGREVGVDIELMRSDFADLQLARQFFSPSEVAALLALPTARRTAAFFAVWTLKEAFLKANGSGLTLGLDHFDVSSALIGPAALRSADAGTELPGWSLRQLDARPGYAAALCIEGTAVPVECWRWAAC